MNIHKDLVLGFDIGTSSLKLVILNLNTNKLEYELSKSTQEAKIETENKLFNEQNVSVLINLVNYCFDRIPPEFLDRLKGVQLCGQMHGIVLWNKNTKIHSNLITWQDARCSENFLNNLPIKSKSDLNSGFGCASLFWLQENPSFKDKNFSDYDSAGTIHDFITFLYEKKLADKNVMSTHNALSWGYLDLEKMNWQNDLDFPSNLLPSVERPGYMIRDLIELPNNERKIQSFIFNALGDLQASVFSCLEKDDDCVINISTSAQVCVAIEKTKYEEIKSNLPKSVTLFPYFGNKVLLVSASLNGGNVLEKFIETILEWNSDLGLVEKTIQKDLIWERVIELSINNIKNEMDSLNCVPTLFGERHDKETFASILNIRSNNLSVGSIFNSLCKGLVRNLNKMITYDLLKTKLGCKRIIATGSALIRNPVLKKSLELEFNYLPVVYKNSADSAYGAASYLTFILNQKN